MFVCVIVIINDKVVIGLLIQFGNVLCEHDLHAYQAMNVNKLLLCFAWLNKQI